MKAILALPPFDQTKTYGGNVFKRGQLPPLGVGYLAASAESRGHEVDFIDAPLYGYDIDGTVAAIFKKKPDIIGISCLTKLASSAYALAASIKEKEPGLPIVMGGPHISSFHETVFNECDSVDCLVPGDGEETFADLLDALENDGDLSQVKGLIYKTTGGEIINTSPREPVRDLDQLPFPLRSIYDNKRYIPLPNQCHRLPATTVITSRGCPYGRCRFCYQGGKYAGSYRRRSAENVVQEIETLVRDMGIREIVFWDDNFCVNYDWIARFCDLLDEKGVKINWSVQGRVNTVSEKMLLRMAKSGCYNVYYGFESGSQETLDFVRKGITLDQSRNAVRWAKKAGMEIRGSFIFAMPGDTPEKAEQTIRFACELNVDWMIFYPYHVQPGTELGDIAATHGAILQQAADMYAPSYVPEGYDSAEQIADIIKSAYRRYYLRPAFILRALWRARDPYVFRNNVLAFWYWLSLMLKKSESA